MSPMVPSSVRPKILTTFLSAIAFASAASGAFAESKTPSIPGRPNVIFVVTDDSCFGDLSCYGNRFFKTPNMDRLHDESIRLNDFHVAPMCTPSRAQFITGMHSMRTGAFLVGTERDHLRTEVPTMPEIFRKNGYRTGIFGKWHLGDHYPLRPQDRGFEETLWFPQAAIGEKVGTHWGDDYLNSHFMRNGQWQQYSGYSTDVFFHEGIQWMEKCARKKEPFFCYFPLNIPHGPYFAPEEERESQTGDARKLGKELRTHIAMITNFDKNMGLLENWLRKSGQWENTIVVYTSDNGGAHGVQLNDHGERGWKSKLTEGGHHVPLFLRWPAGGLRQPTDVPGLAHGVDLLPSLLSLAAIPTEARFDGIDLSPTLRDPAQSLPDRTLIVQCQRAGPVTQEDACIMKGPWRLVGKKELYDLSTDRHQDKNIIAEHPEIAAELQGAFDHFWTEVEPLLDKHGTIVVGNDAENPITLNPSSWARTYFVDNDDVRRGRKGNDHWNVIVDRAGVYEISLRRWPTDVNLPLAAPCPPSKYNDTFCYGLETIPGAALPIAKASLKIGTVFIAGKSDSVAPLDDRPAGNSLSNSSSANTILLYDKTQDIKGDQQVAAVFEVELPAGKAQLQGWFYDASGKPLCGAYYASVRRK